MVQIEMTIDSVRQDLLHYEWVVILREKDAERYLLIYIGSTQAEIIKRLLMGTEPAEQVDFDFPMHDVDINNAELRSAIIHRFKKNVYYAKLLFTHHNKSCKVDCPPAKAIAFAVKSEVPIFAEEVLLNKFAINVRT